MSASPLAHSRRLVIKVGSSLLVRADGEIDRVWLDGLVADVASLKAGDRDVLIVSSGAIALGSRVLGIVRRRARLDALQAAAAAGQVRLAHAWQESLAARDIVAAQILLTLDDTEDRRRFLNVRGTLGKLLEHTAVPVINENDTVATDEIRYGDNDRLAARVAQVVMADCLVLLSDVDGFYTADPGRDAAARHIPVVEHIGDDVMRMAGSTRSEIGSGGMETKLKAARIATHAGCSTIVASGKLSRPLSALADGARHTLFRARGTPAAARKQWLAGVHEIRGEIRIDGGALRALAAGKSLLPVGVSSVLGEFARGDVVRLADGAGREAGRGLAEYSSEEARRLAGCRSEDIEARLGWRGRSVLVHRDDLVLFDDGKPG